MTSPLQHPNAVVTRGINAPKVGSGLVFGKFMPLHNGHLYLLNFARASCHRLTILVCSLANEPIPGEIRFQWVKRLFPDCNVVHHYAPIAQYPEESPTFYNDWVESIRRHCPNEDFDALFASEPYGYDMAHALGTQFIPVDERRELVPISGTKMRENPMDNWDYLNPVVRPYFVKRVAIVGPESSGKTTLTQELAAHFSTVQVHEYARDMLQNYTDHIPDFKPLDGLTEEMFATIARGQLASTEALAEQANRVLFSDTELLTTQFYAQRYLGYVPDMLKRMTERQAFDLYLLQDPRGIEDSYTPEHMRDMPNLDERIACFEWLKRNLNAHMVAGADFSIFVLKGNWETRKLQALRAVNWMMDC